MCDFTAEEAAKASESRLYEALDQGQHFLFEAGAGAGKTYSLVLALEKLIEQKSDTLARSGQSVACISFTNVAQAQIVERTNRHPRIVADTIHSFCWRLISRFQAELKERLKYLSSSKKFGEEHSSLKRVEYRQGYRRVQEGIAELGHDDVPELFGWLLKEASFRRYLQAVHPVILIDEYQDTAKSFMTAVIDHIISEGLDKPQIGFFGDHWQNIYGGGCGAIEHPLLSLIEKNANFRSSSAVVNTLNRIRPKLPQVPRSQAPKGKVQVFLTNRFGGERLDDSGHDMGDLVPESREKAIAVTRQILSQQGWNFEHDDISVLYQYHRRLAEQQGYSSIAEATASNTDLYYRLEDPTIEFLIKRVLPAMEAYQAGDYGRALSHMDKKSRPTCHGDKVDWSRFFAEAWSTLNEGKIGELLDFLSNSQRMTLPYRDAEARRIAREGIPLESVENERLRLGAKRNLALRECPASELKPLAKFIREDSPYATQHGVKGDEFQRVLAVFGGGFSHYNYPRMLEIRSEAQADDNHVKGFLRARNLFYVSCSRAKEDLALLFTQQLSPKALETLSCWFGTANIVELGERL